LAAGGFATAVAAEAQPIGRAEIVALSHSVGRVEARLDDGRVGVDPPSQWHRDVLVTNCHVTSKALSIKVIGGGMPWAVH